MSSFAIPLMIANKRHILEKFMCLSSGFYVTIRAIKSNKVTRADLLDLDTYWLCHDRIGHSGRDMMIYIQKTSHGHHFFRAKRSMNQQLIPGLSVTDVAA